MIIFHCSILLWDAYFWKQMLFLKLNTKGGVLLLKRLWARMSDADDLKDIWRETNKRKAVKWKNLGIEDFHNLEMRLTVCNKSCLLFFRDHSYLLTIFTLGHNLTTVRLTCPRCEGSVRVACRSLTEDRRLDSHWYRSRECSEFWVEAGPPIRGQFWGCGPIKG